MVTTLRIGLMRIHAYFVQFIITIVRSLIHRLIEWDQVFRHFFLPKNCTEETYLQLLQVTIYLVLTNIFEHNERSNEKDRTFQ